jgi:DNA polymerase-3 subunit alpha (Gram-positive type)
MARLIRSAVWVIPSSSHREEAAKGPFLSKDDFRERCHVSGTIIDLLDELGVLGTIPESNQISLFDLV